MQCLKSYSVTLLLVNYRCMLLKTITPNVKLFSQESMKSLCLITKFQRYMLETHSLYALRYKMLTTCKI